LPVRVRFHTDPACPASWALEPLRRRLIVEFGADLSITYVMGGVAREYGAPHEARVREWLELAGRSGMPVDPRIWWDGPLRSSYPACIAVKAAAEQGSEAEERYLRTLREGILCFRRKLDGREALMEEARRSGLDMTRFRVDVDSHAILEAFGADLDATRSLPDQPVPALVFGGDGEPLPATATYDDWRAAALRAGASAVEEPRPAVLAALGRFGRMATAEIEAVCDLPGPRAHAELWRLAAEWRVRPVRVLTGWLWESV
jgi:predicted DsbA family dithiol-disulfide isomerase